jgi:hypothetical protein
MSTAIDTTRTGTLHSGSAWRDRRQHSAKKRAAFKRPEELQQ